MTHKFNPGDVVPKNFDFTQEHEELKSYIYQLMDKAQEMGIAVSMFVTMKRELEDMGDRFREQTEVDFHSCNTALHGGRMRWFINLAERVGCGDTDPADPEQLSSVITQTRDMNIALTQMICDGEAKFNGAPSQTTH